MKRGIQHSVFLFGLLFGIAPILLGAQNLTYQFTQTDSSYTFRGSFRVKVDPDCLLNLCFKEQHIRELALDAKEVIQIEEGNNWNRVRYIYRKFIFFENQTTWYRTLNRISKRIDFSLQSSKNNLSQMPEVIQSSGYYQVREENGFSTLEYYQQCQLTHSFLTKRYLNKAKREAIRFITYFSEYAGSACTQTVPSIN